MHNYMAYNQHSTKVQKQKCQQSASCNHSSSSSASFCCSETGLAFAVCNLWPLCDVMVIVMASFFDSDAGGILFEWGERLFEQILAAGFDPFEGESDNIGGKCATRTLLKQVSAAIWCEDWAGCDVACMKLDGCKLSVIAQGLGVSIPIGAANIWYL